MVKRGALTVTKMLGIPLKGRIANGNNVNSNHNKRFI